MGEPKTTLYGGDFDRKGSESRPVMNDETLHALLVQGDLRVLDILVRRYGARVKAFVRRIVRFDDLAEDITHDVFCKVMEGSAPSSAPQAFTVWLFRVARNLALDALRRRVVRERIERSRPQPVARPAPADAMEFQEFRASIDAALAELPEEFRATFWLRAAEDLSYEDIAEVLDISPKTVSSRLHRVRIHLASRIGRGRSSS